MTRRGPNRSSRAPMSGEQTATVRAAIPNASDTASRDHPNSLVSGFRKMPKVKTSSDAKLTNTPMPDAAATRHPG